MKILVATPLYPPELGGPATYAKLLEYGLPQRGIEVLIVKFNDVRALPKVVRHLAYCLRVFREAHGADLVLALDPVSVGFPAMLAARLRGKPLVVKIVGDFAWEQGKVRFGISQSLDQFVGMKHAPFPLSLFRWMQRRVAHSARAVLVPSGYLKGIVEAWGIPSEKIAVIWNAVAIETSGEVPQTISTLPRPIVVSVGRLVPWKGFSTLIDAVAALRRDVPASLAIVGDGPARAPLEARAQGRLGNGFVFTGALMPDATRAAIASADVFVLDSIYEGLSHVLIEALASGRCVIASDIGGNREIVRNEDNGLLVAPENTRALAEALKRVLTDDALRVRLGTSAKASSEDFHPDTMLGKVADLLQKSV